MPCAGRSSSVKSFVCRDDVVTCSHSIRSGRRENRSVEAGFHQRRRRSRTQERRVLRSSENQTTIVLMIPSFQLSEDRIVGVASKKRKNKPIPTPENKPACVIGLFFRFCLGLRQSCFPWIVSNGIISAIGENGNLLILTTPILWSLRHRCLAFTWSYGVITTWNSSLVKTSLHVFHFQEQRNVLRHENRAELRSAS